MSLDLEVDFDSIAYAVETGKSKSAIEFLIELYNGDLDQEWSHGNYSMNLVLAAARENRVDLVELFSDLGVKKQTKHSILDVLPSPENEYEIEKLIDIATLALEDGQRPFYKESANRLETWMPEAFKEAYIHQLQVERSLPPKLEERLESFIAWHEQVSNKIVKPKRLKQGVYNITI